MVLILLSDPDLLTVQNEGQIRRAIKLFEILLVWK